MMYPIYTATQTSYVHLSIVNIVFPIEGSFMKKVILHSGRLLKVIPLKLFYYQTFFETWRN